MKHCLKYILILPPIALCAAALILSHREQPPQTLTIPAAAEPERIAYLRSQGWEGELLSSQAVIVPQEDAVYAEYAGLQRRQQLPLYAYTGKRAVVYTYALENTELYAELLTADGILIGAQCYSPEEHITLDIRGKTFHLPD